MDYVVKVDFIEWCDDAGQDKAGQLPSSLDEDLHVESSGDSDDLGCAVFDKLEAIYKVRPVLVYWWTQSPVEPGVDENLT